ncbi:hypothetical protein N825_07830 [Skermanella stibiiresistens SB22]|uniref:Uncharacterized protein n=1 Tax=Skermanella stibiiresistens SB22 TaxID=1385369 RepID=W9H6A4_9PROT|nr:hypothetical protein [Skermanella stibiiresistens]EWY39293.1 hypothetical protein N825_07830 [Skermanella stibiiresistens SB22]
MPLIKQPRARTTVTAHSNEETEFPRFTKPVGAVTRPVGPGPSIPQGAAEAPTRRARSSRFLLGFIVGLVAAAFGIAALSFMLVGGDLTPGPQRPARQALVVTPDSVGAPLPLELPEPAPPAAEPPPPTLLDPTPPTTPLPSARLFVHHVVGASWASQATAVVGALQTGGLTVIDTRQVQGNISTGNVRFFFEEDRDAATRLAELLGGLYGERFGAREFRLIDFTHYSPKPRQRTLEIWLPN